MATAERKRYQALRAVSVEFKVPGLLDQWVANGTDPDVARSQRAEIRDADARLFASGEVRPIPRGEYPEGAAAVECLLSQFLGRPDVARGVEVSGAPARAALSRDSLALVAGVTGQGADPWTVYQTLLRTQEAGSIITDRVAFAAAPGALGAGSQAAALRDALDMILAFDWPRAGQFWRAATRMMLSPDMRPRRWWVASSGASEQDEIPESGSAERSPDGGSGGWCSVDLRVTNGHREELLLSYERFLNNGGIELSSWISGRLRLWHDTLDRQVATLLTSAKVATNAGMFDADHFSAATAALNTRLLGGVPLGSSMPVAICGENRRALMSAVPGPRQAAGDESAVLSAVAYSASVPGDFLVLIHPHHLPVGLAYSGAGVEPRAVLGPFSGVTGTGPGDTADRGVCVYQHRSAPGLLTDSDGNAVGAIRMIT